jgi:hypothetical protein
MADVAVLAPFHSGKRTVRGEPNPDLREWEVALAIRPVAIDRALGVRSPEERVRVLRALREQGKLACNRGRLTHRVRTDGRPPDGTRAPRGRAYIFPNVDSPDTVRHLADRVLNPERYAR